MVGWLGEWGLVVGKVGGRTGWLAGLVGWLGTAAEGQFAAGVIWGGSLAVVL